MNYGVCLLSCIVSSACLISLFSDLVLMVWKYLRALDIGVVLLKCLSSSPLTPRVAVFLLTYFCRLLVQVELICYFQVFSQN